MPEQLTKYPDITIKVLKSAGARCGEGLKQSILTQCPAEKFCSLPRGEICVYGINEIPKMTQITKKELAQVVCPKGQELSLIPNVDVLILGLTLSVGVIVGGFAHKLRQR